MINLNKVTLSLIALGVSSVAFAGHPGDDTMLPAATAGVNLTAPHQAGSWSFGVEALYWQAANNDFNYAQVATADAFNPGDPGDDLCIAHFRTVSVEPEGDWGFRADATYHFAGNGRDVSVSYTDVHNSNSDSVNPALKGHVGDTVSHWTSAGQNSNPISQRNFFTTSIGDAWDSAKGSSKDEYAAVDLTFGQMIHVGQRVYLHPFAGLRWADIDNRDKASYVFVTTGGDQTASENLDARIHSSFTGIGPRFGTDAQVNVGSGWSFRGRVGVSLLVGDFSNSAVVAMTSWDDGTPPTIGSQLTENYRSDSQTRVVPEMDARLGVNYSMNLSNGYGVGFEAGYEVTNYFDAVDNSMLNFSETSAHDSDFGIHGPYLRFQLDIA